MHNIKLRFHALLHYRKKLGDHLGKDHLISCNKFHNLANHFLQFGKRKMIGAK